MRSFAILAALLGTTAVFADATNVRPTTVDGTSLQDALDAITISGPGIDVANDQSSFALFTNQASGGSVATFVLELADNAGSNRFGIYSAGDTSNRAQIFAGSDGNPSQALVSFFANGDVRVNGVLVATSFGPNFGMYVEVYGDDAVLDYTVYTEDSENGGNAQALVFQGDGQTTIQIPSFSPGIFSSEEWIFAFEDLLQGEDTEADFDDLVVLIESISPVPVPGAALLGALGLGIIGGLRRRNA